MSYVAGRPQVRAGYRPDRAPRHQGALRRHGVHGRVLRQLRQEQQAEDVRHQGGDRSRRHSGHLRDAGPHGDVAVVLVFLSTRS